MIYYPFNNFNVAGIKDILIITTQKTESFEELFGDGKQFGINISFATQQKPEGLAQAFIITKFYTRSARGINPWRQFVLWE